MTQRNRDSIFLRLQEHFADPVGVILTPVEQEVLDRWDFCDNQIRSGTIGRPLVNMLMRKFSISSATAYRDIQNTQTFFGSLVRSDKEYWRLVVRDMAISLYNQAKAAGDTGKATAALRTIIRTLGLDKQDPDLPDFEALQAHNYELILPDHLKETLEQFSRQSVLRLDELRKSLPEGEKYDNFIEAEEVPDE